MSSLWCYWLGLPQPVGELWRGTQPTRRADPTEIVTCSIGYVVVHSCIMHHLASHGPDVPCTLFVARLPEALVCTSDALPPQCVGQQHAQRLGRPLHSITNDTVRIKIHAPWREWIIDFERQHVSFPEEGVRLVSDLAEHENRDLRPRTITERLLRRIVAKLYRANILDATRHIVNTGSWIGDNAVPWAVMLDQLRPGRAGTVIAVDPSVENVLGMAWLARANRVRNLCMRAATFSDHAHELVYEVSRDEISRMSPLVDVVAWALVCKLTAHRSLLRAPPLRSRQ